MDRSVVNVSASSAKIANGNSNLLPVPQNSLSLAIEVVVTAIGGVSPNLALTVQWSQDGVNIADADPVDAFTAIVGVGNKSKTFAIKGEFYRLVWALTGTSPSFTFAATAYGV